jgi:LCP family protein required for cell wall assembly
LIDWGKIFRIAAAVAAAILISVITILAFQLSGMKKQMADTENSFLENLEQQKMLIDQLSQNIQILSSGSNEVRRYMSLPEKQLIQSRTGESETIIDPSVSFFDAFNYLVSQENEDLRAAAFSMWLNDGGVADFFTDRNYKFARVNSVEAKVQQNSDTLIHLYYNHDERVVEFSDIGENNYSVSIDTSPEALLSEAVTSLETYRNIVGTMEQELRSLFVSEEIGNILKERGLFFEEVNSGTYNLKNRKDDSFLSQLGRKKTEYQIGGNTYTTLEDFKENLLVLLDSISTETESERIDALVLSKMEEVFADEGFKVLLESENCVTKLQREEDDEFIYFHIYRTDGTIKGSYALQKEFGEVLLLSGDGKYLTSLDGFTPENDFQSLIIEEESKQNYSPFAFDDSSDTFLVVGTHEHNADTMILVNADNRTGKIQMISFPRDLYYKGNKINNIYKEHGPARLARELSDITGLSIKKYVSIDMFAFVDVINILGGIDVTLDSDLIDPTYKVKNNGIWSTLYYRKGTHHLDGVEALRVARSRHGSEAYDRSRRQQLIVKAVMNKMRDLGAGDMSTLYDFVTSVFSYIDTNLSIADLVKSFVMYKDNEIEDPVTLNLDNILVARWSNTYLLPLEEEKKLLADDDFFAGQWIVVPKDNDWDIFNRFIGNIFNSGK